MRFRSLLLLLPAVLGACSKTAAPVQLDLVGTTGLTSGSRTVAPGDSLVTRAYAVGNDTDLARLRVTVKYEPTRNPIVYPIPLSSYDPGKTPNDDELVYVDSLLKSGVNLIKTDLARGGEFVLVNKFTARATSGTELWQYAATDNTNQRAARAYRLTVRKADSAAVFHSYTVRLQPAMRRATADSARVRDQARRFLGLRPGLLLPKHAVINDENSLFANQQLIDLVAVATGSALSLSAPANPGLRLNPLKWPVTNRRATQLRATGLSASDFNKAATTQEFATAFAGGRAFATNPLSTGTLAREQVVAFSLTENGQAYAGLLLVVDVVSGTSPVLTIQVKVQK